MVLEDIDSIRSSASNSKLSGKVDKKSPKNKKEIATPKGGKKVAAGKKVSGIKKVEPKGKKDDGKKKKEETKPLMNLI